MPCEVITPPGAGARPVLIWIHGGGWVVGTAAESTVTCQRLAAGAGCIVVNVDYRLAPEHPFPGGAGRLHRGHALGPRPRGGARR